MNFIPVLSAFLFAFFLSPLTLTASITGCVKTCPFEQQTLPLTAEEVEKYLLVSEENILEVLDHLISLPDAQKTSENLMKPWNRLSNQIIENFRVLTFLAKSDFPSKIEAGAAIQKLQVFLLKSLVHNADLYRSLIAYINKSLREDKSLSPYEHHEIHCVLKSCEKTRESLLKEDQELLNELQDLSSKHERAPFAYLKSQTPEKVCLQSHPQEGFTVFCLNTCFIDGNALLFGGVHLPWQQRVSPLTDKILSANADVVCLQEVFAEEASYALYEGLKNTYTYFYVAIGPRILGFSLDTVGAPSGLFVASKYPIENPQFTLFSTSGFPMNYGVFDFVVKNGKTSIGHVYTTHLQSLNYNQFELIRASQLNQILEKMKADQETQNETMPFFLCGDLNIPYASQEPAETLIHTYFYDDYNKNQRPIDASNRTCTDYFTNYIFSSSKNPEEVDPNFQILDYALLLRSLPSLAINPSVKDLPYAQCKCL